MKSERPWTPGPWHMSDSCVVDENETVIVSNGLAQTHGYIDPGDVSRSNDRLIAAAPELYEALEQALWHLREHNNDYHHVTSSPQLAVIEGALDKANPQRRNLPPPPERIVQNTNTEE